MSTLQSPYLRQYKKSTVAILVAAILLSLLFGGLAVLMGIRPAIEHLTSAYSETTATAVDEGARSVSVGSRRTRRTEQRRTVTLEYTYEGTKRTASPLSDEVQVGQQVTIWIDTASPDRVLLAKPIPTVWTWVFAAAALLVILGFLWWLVSIIRTLVAVSSFDPAHALGHFTVEVRHLADKALDQNRNASGGNLSRQVTGVVHSSTVKDYAVGDQMIITGKGPSTPTLQELAGPMEGLIVRKGTINLFAAVRRQGTDAWWIGTLGKPTPSVTSQA